MWIDCNTPESEKVKKNSPVFFLGGGGGGGGDTSHPSRVMGKIKH